MGERGSVCEVSDGYALNHLIPQGKAVDMESAQGKAAMQQRTMQQKKTQQRSGAEDQSFATLPDTITLKLQANKDGTLFTSIRPDFLCSHLKKEGHTIPSKWFSFDPIKKIGEYTVTAKRGTASKKIVLMVCAQ